MVITSSVLQRQKPYCAQYCCRGLSNPTVSRGERPLDNAGTAYLLQQMGASMVNRYHVPGIHRTQAAQARMIS
jgi:hypothetical protein